MALKIRLQRRGAKADPVYRAVVADVRAPRDGDFVEELGLYKPNAKGQDPKFRLNLERIEYWLTQGAQPSDTVKALIKQARKLAESAENGIVTASAA